MEKTFTFFILPPTRIDYSQASILPDIQSSSTVNDFTFISNVCANNVNSDIEHTLMSS
jgi:hypothetical protein